VFVGVRVGVPSGGAVSQAQADSQLSSAISAQPSSQKSVQQKSSSSQTQAWHTASEQPGPSSGSRPAQQLLAGPGEPDGVGVIRTPHRQTSMHSSPAAATQLGSQTSAQQKSSTSHTQLSQAATSQPAPSSRTTQQSRSPLGVGEAAAVGGGVVLGEVVGPGVPGVGRGVSTAAPIRVPGVSAGGVVGEGPPAQPGALSQSGSAQSVRRSASLSKPSPQRPDSARGQRFARVQGLFVQTAVVQPRGAHTAAK
jgi:hypothetical protein